MSEIIVNISQTEELVTLNVVPIDNPITLNVVEDVTLVTLNVKSGGSGVFNPSVDTIGDITPVNTVIVDDDTINDFASKTQGQINTLYSDLLLYSVSF